jgi:hypothetical protein
VTLAVGATVGTTTLSWNAPGHNTLQIRVAGVLFAAGLPASGSINTGNWVADGTSFSLADSASGQTIATLVAHTTATTGQVTFTASPNPIMLASGVTVGKTTLNWNAPGYSALQIRVSGVLFASGLSSSGSINTGNWVSDGLPFSLVNPVNGQTVATVTVAAK